ncbi:MAG: methylated-DNA--[protein]-cysteine S-methyltransferase [Nitrospinae bacterium]|nr:methylated-DNA--[protein]-cysteine S-methyltransferase [Nitrospinota bacterium]
MIIGPVDPCGFITVRLRSGYAGVAFSGNGVVKIILPGLDRDRLRKLLSPWAGSPPSWAGDLAERVKRYFAGERVEFDDPVDMRGAGEFARRIYTELRRVKWGEMVTYGGLAARVGNPSAARAVGMVMAKNPVPLIVPCHRVARSDGGLGGFSAPGGVDFKKTMLALERG